MVSFLITGCSSSEKFDSSEIEKFDVKNITDKTTQDYFTFRLVSEKEQYKEGEEVNLYGEILYNGDKEKVIIHHSSSPIFFNLREEIRGYEIGYAVQDIGTSTTLNRLGKPGGAKYDKSSVLNSPYDNTSEDYLKFMEEFLKGDGFPPGYYTVKGTTDFSAEGSEQERYNLEATIDFKVVE